MGWPAQAAEVTMEMTWENLAKLFTWTAQHGSEAPMADTAGEQIVIDGAIKQTVRKLSGAVQPMFGNTGLLSKGI
jgi:membrane carboxypeptidase/penicillin-binding protein PbpC